MSIPDHLLINWFELCTDIPMTEARELVAAAQRGEINPRDVKMRLAREIVTLYHGADASQEADNYFIETFSKRVNPVESAEEVAIPADCVQDGAVSIPALIVGLGGADSNGNAKKLMQAGAVSLDGEKITDLGYRPAPSDLMGKVLKVGKHFFRKLRG